MMRRASISDEASLLRLSWGNAGAAGFLGAWWSGRPCFFGIVVKVRPVDTA